MRALLSTLLIVAAVAAAVALVVAGFRAIDGDRDEVSGTGYAQLAVAARVCPQLAPDIRRLAKQRVITLGEAKAMGKRLHEAARAYDVAMSKREGRMSLGMDGGKEPPACSDDNDDAYDSRKLLDDGYLDLVQD